MTGFFSGLLIKSSQGWHRRKKKSGVQEGNDNKCTQRHTTTTRKLQEAQPTTRDSS